MPKNRYSDDFRASAVLMLQAAGYPDESGALTRVAARVGVPHQTLSRWARGVGNPPPHEMVQIKKEDLEKLILKEAHAIFEFMPDAREVANYRELATAFGILIDKLQLLTGEPTQRVKLDWRDEAREQGLSDEEIAALFGQDVAVVTGRVEGQS